MSIRPQMDVVKRDLEVDDDDDIGGLFADEVAGNNCFRFEWNWSPRDLLSIASRRGAPTITASFTIK